MSKDDFDIDDLLRSIEGLENELGTPQQAQPQQQFSNPDPIAKVVIHHDRGKGTRTFDDIRPALTYINKNKQFIHSVIVLHPHNSGSISLSLKDFFYYLGSNREEFGLSPKPNKKKGSKAQNKTTTKKKREMSAREKFAITGIVIIGGILITVFAVIDETPPFEVVKPLGIVYIIGSFITYLIARFSAPKNDTRSYSDYMKYGVAGKKKTRAVGCVFILIILFILFLIISG